MTKRNFLTYILIFFIALNAKSQNQIKEFTADVLVFPKELKEFFKTAQDERAAHDFMDLFLDNYWKKEQVKFDESEKEYIYKMCNWMLKKRLKPTPDFKAFLMSMVAFKDGKKDARTYILWQKALEKLQMAKTLTPFQNYIAMTENLFANNTIYKSVTTQWRATSNNWTLEFDSVPKVKFAETDIACYTIGDSLVMHKTIGTYFPTTFKWIGKGGFVDWKRAGLDDAKIFAEINRYVIDFKKSGYEADSVVYHNPNYFDKALLGVLKDKVLSDMDNTRAIYPEFNSYDKRLQIKNIYKEVDYDGGFAVKGAKVIGAGNAENPAFFKFWREGKLFLSVKAQSFILRPDRIASERVAAAFYWETDSMFHPGIPFKFLVKEREVSMIRDNTGIAQTPFFNTFHKVDMYFEELFWKMDQPKIEMKMIIGANESNANFESTSYFRDLRWERIQGMQDVNPLFKIKAYAKQTPDGVVDVDGLAKYMNIAPSEVYPFTVGLAIKGFVSYIDGQKKFTLKEKALDYPLFKMAKKDYDVIEFNSSLPGDKVNASINLLNFDLKINGIKQISLSDSQKVNITPTGGQIIVKKNRDFSFAGIVDAGRFTFYGKEFSFEYDKFKINLKNTDSLKIKVLSKIKNEYGEFPLIEVKTAIENIEGDLLIDNPNNKSGRVNFPEYPIFNSKKDSYAYWDKRSVQRGVYTRDKVYFHLEPFTIDSLDNFTNEALHFSGDFESGGIFPNIHENLVLMPDYSLGIDTKTDGLIAYADKGKFTSKITMSNRGLRADGTLDYVTSTFKSDDFVFFPDSMNAVVQSFEERPQTSAIEFPTATSNNNYVHWMPYKDYMTILEKDKPIAMFEGKSIFHGQLTLTPKRLSGNGKSVFYKASLTAKLQVFKNQIFDSDTCDFDMENLSDSTGIAFLSKNLKAHIDFTSKIADFTSNGGGSYVNFPVNQYICFMDNFKWYMDKANIELSASEGAKKNLDTNDDLDLTGAEFISTHPEQDSLRFLSPKAKYDLRKNIVKCADVRYMNVADARIYPDSGKVIIYKKAKLETLRNAKIIANTTTRYHSMFDATVDVFGRKHYDGIANYKYIDELKQEQLLHFDKVTADATGQTVATGNIPDSLAFELSPAFECKGKITLQASVLNLFFKGSFRIKHECARLVRSWVQFDADVNPAEVYIPISERLVDVNNLSVGAGMNLSTDSLHVYPSFLSNKRQASDPEIASAYGFLFYDKKSKEYKIGSKEKIKEINFPGDYVSLNTKDCEVYAEGKLYLTHNTGQVNLLSYGSGKHNLITDTCKFETIMALDFFFENGLIKDFGEKLEKATTLEGTPLNRPMFERSLRLMLGKEIADKLISQVNLYGAFKKIPDELEHTFFFNDVKMKWNPETRSFVSIGKIGLGSIFKNQMNKYLNGKIEIVQKKSGDSFTIYLLDDNNNYLFFQYAQNQMQAYSSDEKFNTALRELKPEKRKQEKDKQPTFTFQLGNSSAVSKFVKKFKE